MTNEYTMRLYLILALISLFCFSAQPQNFYVVSQRDNPLVNKTFMLNVNNCDSFPIFTCPPTNNINQLPENQYTDISINFSSMYFVSGWGSLYVKNLNDTVSCQYLGNFNYNINALATANTGVVYATGQVNGICKLFKYQGGSFTLLGSLPSNFYSAGDLFFYENRLFMTGTTSDFLSGYIVEVDVDNPNQSCYYMTLPNLQAWGGFSVNNGNLSRVFIISVNNTGGVHTSSLYEINMQNKTIGPVMCTYPFFINGAATVYSFANPGNTLCDATALNVRESSQHLFRVQNPVVNQLHIETDLDPSQIGTAGVFDPCGNFVKSLNADNIASGMDVSNLAPGFYIIKLITQKGREYKQKVIIQN